MNREKFTAICSRELKSVRTEYGYSQEVMSHLLGITKKTLIGIEKGRSRLSWQGSVTLCFIFGGSEVLAGIFGGNPSDMIMALAFDGNEPVRRKTMGGRVWWSEVENAGEYRLQQNIISRHYRILDGYDRRICSGFDYEEIRKNFEEVQKDGNNGYV